MSRSRYWTIATAISIYLLLPSAAEERKSLFLKLAGLQPAQAQFIRPRDVGQEVYERLPDLPLENQHISAETGEVDGDNTLIGRLIRYHIYVKNRPPNFRLDWKLTIADYLGAHEYLLDSEYPGHDSLRENPMESDMAAIASLTRSQRDALVGELVSIFNPNRSQAEEPVPTASPQAPPTNPNPRTREPIIPEPGDAQLLQP